MKNTTMTLLSLIAPVLVSACQAEDKRLNSLDTGNVLSMSDVKVNDAFVPKQVVSYIPGNYGKYTKYLKSTDCLVGLSSTKPSPWEARLLRGYVGPTAGQATKSDTESPIKATLDGMEYPSAAATKADGGVDFFGRKVVFGLSGQLETKSGAVQEDYAEVEMYVPQEIELLSPVPASAEESFPLCYYDGFELRWNADPQNENGVIVVVDWVGETVIGRDVPNTSVRHFCTLPDTGSGVLDTEMFEGIPDTAICHLTLLRGNIEIAAIGTESCKVMAESHEFLTFILIREIL